MIDIFEMLDVQLCFDGVLSFFCTAGGKRVAHFLVLHFGRLKCREHLLDRIEFISVGADCIYGDGRFFFGVCWDFFQSDCVDVGF